MVWTSKVAIANLDKLTAALQTCIADLNTFPTAKVSTTEKTVARTQFNAAMSEATKIKGLIR